MVFQQKMKARKQMIQIKRIPLSPFLQANENFNFDNIRHILIALTVEYMTYLHRLNLAHEDNHIRMEEISDYISKLHKKASVTELKEYSMHFCVFFDLKDLYIKEGKKMKDVDA